MNDLIAWAPLLLLAVLGLAFVMVYARIQRSGVYPVVRPLAALDALRALTERAIEEGRAAHIAVGTGSVAGERAVETMVGLAAVNDLAEEARRANQFPVVTTADPAAQLLAGEILAQDAGARRHAARDDARFIAPEGIAYGVGTRAVMRQEQLGLTVVLGDIGDEYLYIAAERPGGGNHLHPPEVAGTTRLETLPLVHLSARNPLLGEELFAYGAYLGNSAQHWASVVVQDAGRVLLILLIVAGVIAATVMG